MTSFAQNQNTKERNHSRKQTKQHKKLLKLIITDPIEAVVPNARVRIINSKTGEEQKEISNQYGELEFVIGKLGNYTIVIDGIAGFEELEKNVSLTKDNLKKTLKLKLEQAVIGLMMACDEVDTIIGTTNSIVSEQIDPRKIEPLPPNTPFFLGLISSKQVKESKKLQSLQHKTGRISFTVTDTLEAVIPNAKVKLTNYKTNQEFTAETDEKGVAYFSLLPYGRYKVGASAGGFTSGYMTVSVKEPIEPNIEILLEVGTFTGIVSINWYEIPIFNSIVQDDFDVVKNYISQGKRVDLKDKFRGNASMLHVAAESGNFEIIKLLANAGADVNAKDKIGRTPIMMLDLDEEDSLQIIKFLIARRANLNIRNKDEGKETLLMTACENDDFELVKILLESGAKTNLKDEDGETALMKTTSEEIKSLLKKYQRKQ